jgi:hypothetical protein
MPDQASLDEILAELHEVLEASSDLDDEARARLRHAAHDIERAMRPEAEPEGRTPSLRERLTGAIENFEDEHPRLTAIVGRIADQLSDMGI